MTPSAVPILAMLPLLVFGGAAVLRPAPPIEPKHVATEGVRVIAMDTRTFSARWRPIHDLAPATVIREVPVPAAAKAAATVPLPPARIVRRAMLRTSDVCSRHGLRRVEYLKRGYKHWRCRR